MPTTLDAFYPFVSQALSNANWQNYLLLFSTDGVRQTLGGTGALAVTQRGAGVNKSVDVAAGRLLIQGLFGENSTTKNLVIADNPSGFDRIDLAIVRIVQATPTVQLDILQGTPDGVPVAPTLTQSASIYEVPLAQIAVANGFASIVTANITDKRGWGGAQATRPASVASATALPYTPYTSAAPIVILPVTGATNITSIPAAPAGSIMILEFASVGCTVTLGSNLILAGRSFTSAGAPSTLMLHSDGTNWIEDARGADLIPAHKFLGNGTGSPGLTTIWSIGAADLPLFATWTPVVTQAASTPTFTNNFSRTVQFGKFAMISANLSLTSAGTGANAVIVTLPVGLTMAAGQNVIGSFVYNDISVQIYPGVAVFASATTVQFIAGYNVATTGFLGAATPNFAIANGDSLSFVLNVELA